MASLFTATSAYSLAAVAAIGLVAYVAANVLLPKTASQKDRFTFIWLVSPRSVSEEYSESNHVQAFDALIHFTFEGSFLYLSTFGRQVNHSEGPFAQLCTSFLPDSHFFLESRS